MRSYSILLVLTCLAACGDDAMSDAGTDARSADTSVDVPPQDAFSDDGAASDAATDGAADATLDAGSDAGEADGGPGRVPLFLAVGWGGRRIVSCDMGRTWVADTFESTEDDWHQPFTPKSLAYHEGLFVHMTGWGAPSTIHTSRDGLEWTSVELEDTAGAIGFDDRWVALASRRVYVSGDAASWAELEDVEGSRLNRDGAVYPGMWITGTDGEVRYNQGGGWVALESCTGERHGSIGVSGGFVAGPDRVISLGMEGTTCVVDRNTGEDLGSGDIGADRVQGVGAYVNGEFWLGTGGRLYRSADGLSWTSEAMPDGVRFEHLADSGEGTIAAANRNGDAFYYSDDGGISWQQAEAPEGNNIYRMVFGWAEPSAQCPGSP